VGCAMAICPALLAICPLHSLRSLAHYSNSMFLLYTTHSQYHRFLSLFSFAAPYMIFIALSFLLARSVLYNLLGLSFTCQHIFSNLAILEFSRLPHSFYIVPHFVAQPALGIIWGFRHILIVPKPNPT